MPFGPTLVKPLLCVCLLLCLCNGAPPNQVAKQGGFRERYTTEEDAFILEELSRIPGDNIPINSNKLWKDIAQKHAVKRNHGTTGFDQERSARGMKDHFFDTLLCFSPDSGTKVPRELLQRFAKPGGKRSYNAYEEDLMIEYLSKKTCSDVCGSSTVKAIQEAHDKNRQAEASGFKLERSYHSIRKHLLKMKKDGKLPDEILTKIYNQRAKKDAGSSSSSKNVQTDLEVTNIGSDDEWTADVIKELQNTDVTAIKSDDDKWIADMIKELQKDDFFGDSRKMP